MARFRSVWDHLYSRERHTIFQSYAWNHLAAQSFASREAPFVVFAETDSSVAIVPAAIRGRSQVTLVGEMLFDYRSFLHAGDDEALRAAAACIAELGLPVTATGVRHSDVALFRPLRRTLFCNAPAVRRDGFTADQFAAEHSRLGRHFRRLARQRTELRQYFGDHSALVRWIYQRKAEQFEDSGTNIFGDPSRVEFMVRAAAMDPTHLEIFTIETMSQVIAALVTLRDGDVRRFYTVWYDESWAQYSPGVVLVFAITQRSLAENLDCDYMTGEQPHKLRLATHAVPLYRVEASARRLQKAAAIAEPELTPKVA